MLSGVDSGTWRRPGLPVIIRDARFGLPHWTRPMRMSTQHGGGSRRPSANKAVAGGKPNLSKETDDGATPAKATGAAKKAAPAKKATGARPVGARPAAKAGGRRPVTPMRVSQGRNWGPIAMFAAVPACAVIAATTVAGSGSGGADTTSALPSTS